MRRSPRASLALLVAAAAIAAGCGSDAEGEDSEAAGVGESIGGSVAALANCSDWNEGTEAERRATIEDVARASSPQTSEETATSLSDEDAYRLFENSCEEEFARSLELYKLYARANAFAPLTNEEDPAE